MGDKSKIEWTDATWNPVRGCSRVSEGCRHCYAEGVAARFSGPGQPYEGLAERTAKGPRWTGKVRLIESQLDLPLRWRKPRRIFVNSMCDLFHESLPDLAIDRVFAIMALAPHHTFQVLTKRPERMRAYLTDSATPLKHTGSWPLPNVWLGVSVENQEAADERIPLLLDTPAAVRFLSCEPLLRPVDLTDYLVETARTNRDWYLDWIISGGESGTGARPCHPDWIRTLRDQCAAASVPFFFKQWGAWAPAYDLPSEQAESLELQNRYERLGDIDMVRVGKKAAGAILDGRAHREFPR